IYELEVRGTQGIILWLLQQKDEIEVLSPQSLRDEVKEIISRMYQVYQ
ncbi:MAG TPA: WYL domain-containing protein, partial [Paenibacillaceae bacterium]|nr:WYL domain-containing protein [Paenibacillaceae bacterium]